MAAAALERAVPQLGAVFAGLAAGIAALHEHADLPFSDAPPSLTVHAPMATGADQMAATAARRQGFRVRAVLPFPRAVYLEDFAEGAERAEFDAHMDDADAVFTLPGSRADGDDAYMSVGHMVIATSDILVAVWDGAPSRGRGGTGDIVAAARRRGIPVVHIPVSENLDEAPPPPVVLRGFDEEPAPADSAGLIALVAEALGPPADVERAQLAQYLGETERTRSARIEYPLLLALTGVKRLSRGAWRQDGYQDSAAAEWARLRARTADAGADFARGLDDLQRAYGWANGLAIRYAQLFRSGHVLNYALSALAVMLALAGLIAPEVKFWLVAAELGVIALLYLNTRAGHRGDWHRRWLQYRHLAETLRPLPYLLRTGVALPPFLDYRITSRSRRADRGTRWTRWYAAAIWRQMPGPAGVVTPDTVRDLAALMIEEQLQPQAAYHKVNAHRMHVLDHRLHHVGNILMGGVVLACLTFLTGYLFFQDWTLSNVAWFIVVTAGLPAIGAAVYGIRGHGEFVLAASRSAATADDLEAAKARMDGVRTLDDLAEELEGAAAIMLADLGEWTMAYQERQLAIPA